MRGSTLMRQSLSLCCVVQASTFVMFPHMKQACEAALVLRNDTAVDAVEVFDRASIK